MVVGRNAVANEDVMNVVVVVCVTATTRMQMYNNINTKVLVYICRTIMLIVVNVKPILDVMIYDSTINNLRLSFHIFPSAFFDWYSANHIATGTHDVKQINFSFRIPVR